ncbi:MAG: methylmalonyl-CoA mutase subunit beta [Flavobacteriaceae bacterium]|nr:methylmalonyl-CoA mutase subunit beta [Flavobacteriaceae bacterium]
MSDSLFNSFDAVSAKAWKQKIQADLRGKDYNDTLVWQSPEGIHVKPFYHRDQLEDIIALDTPTDRWEIGQCIDLTDADQANKTALDRLQRGAETLIFSLHIKEINLTKALQGIPKNTKMIFHLNLLEPAVVAPYLESLENYSKTTVVVDTVGHLAQSGNWYQNMEEDQNALSKLLQANKQVRLGINATIYQNAGADMVQQLAYTMAHAVEYMSLLESQNINTDRIHVQMAIGGNYFFEIAKLKATRYLWEHLIELFPSKPKLHITATPSKRNKTLYDYNVNMLRTTTECMSAILGGADLIHNSAYDAIYHKENEFGDRIARNQLLILKKEAYLDKVHNPTEGAYYVESLTKQLSEKALDLLKEIEKGGGFLSQLKKGKIQEKIQEKEKESRQKIENQEDILVGTNRFENEKDQMKNDLEIAPFLEKKARKTLIVPIIPKRLAEQIERKRLEDE